MEVTLEMRPVNINKQPKGWKEYTERIIHPTLSPLPVLYRKACDSILLTQSLSHVSQCLIYPLIPIIINLYVKRNIINSPMKNIGPLSVGDDYDNDDNHHQHHHLKH